jgi:hypothetical protein
VAVLREPDYLKYYVKYAAPSWYDHLDVANSSGTSVWSSTAVSGNYSSYTQFIDSLIFDRLGKVEEEIKYYMNKLSKKVDDDILKALKSTNAMLETAPQEECLFDPENLWSEPTCLKIKNVPSVGQT